MKKISLIVLLACVFLVQSVYAADYYVAPNGNNNNPGTITQPWADHQRATDSAGGSQTHAGPGDTVYIRGGIYDAPNDGYKVLTSGTAANPITFTNYPGEQAIFLIENNHNMFRCHRYRPASINFKADHIKVLGTDVTPQTLPNGVVSEKGIVAMGLTINAGGRAFTLEDCDYWEIAGIDFVWTGFPYWDWNYEIENPDLVQRVEGTHLHHNRVWNWHKESGFQMNGVASLIEHNEIYVTDSTQGTPYGCQFILIQGNDHVVRNNYLESQVAHTSRDCWAIDFEFDFADENEVYGNTFVGTHGIIFSHGDNNKVFNNIITAVPGQSFGAQHGGIEMRSQPVDSTAWPCSDAYGHHLNPSDTDHPYYEYYFPPGGHNCLVTGIEAYNNLIIGYPKGISIHNTLGGDHRVQNNIILNSLYGDVCFDNNGYTSTCNSITSNPSLNNVVSNNLHEDDFNNAEHFVDYFNGNFEPTSTSPVIDSGIDLTGIFNSDFNGIIRPQGSGYDIGPFEYAVSGGGGGVVKDGVTPVGSGTPFYIDTGYGNLETNPVNCGNMEDGDACETTWTVRATGDAGTQWDMFAIANSIESGSVNSEIISVMINSILSCSDNNIHCVDDDVGVTQEYSTIQAAVNVANAGDTVLVYPGDYEGEGVVTTSGSGTSSNMITIKSQTRRQAIANGFDINHDYIRVEGFEVTDATSDLVRAIASSGDGVEIIDNYVQNTGQWGIHMSGNDFLVKDNYVFEVQMGISASGSDYLIENNEIEHLKNHGFGSATTFDYMRFFGGSNGIIRGNYLHGTILSELPTGTHLDGLQTFNSLPTNTIIENNIFLDQHQGIIVDSSGGYLIIRNNIFRGVEEVDGSNRRSLWGIHVRNAPDVRIYNNAFVWSRYPAIEIQQNANAIIKNNIFYDTRQDEFNSVTDAITTLNGGVLTEVSHNLYYSPTYSTTFSSPHTGDIVQQDPMFVSYSEINSQLDDYHLQAGSPALDAGFDLSSEFNHDLEGNLRPQGSGWDIGPYELFQDCTQDSDCSNGLVCDGVETCNVATGICEDGNDFVCGSGTSCVEPGVCAGNCGNGIVGSGEQCDDGNLLNGDGCSSSCEIENGCSLTGALVDYGITPESGQFTFTYSATPQDDTVDALLMLSDGPQPNPPLSVIYTHYAARIRFSQNGVIDARNGAGYSAVNVMPYTKGTRYDFRVEVNLISDSYDVFVTPYGGAEVQIANDYSFGTGIETQIDNYATISEVGSMIMCNPQVGAQTPSEGTVSIISNNNPTITVNQDGSFSVTYTATCTGGDCGVVDLILDPIKKDSLYTKLKDFFINLF